MTKKDFILIAETIGKLPYSKLRRQEITGEFVVVLAAANPKFKPETFRNHVEKVASQYHTERTER